MANILSSTNAPIPGKKPEVTAKDLNLVSKKEFFRHINTRMRVEVCDIMDKLVNEINEQLTLPLSRTRILEALIIHASKDPKKTVGIIKNT